MKKKMAIICSTDYTSYPMGGMMSYIVDILPKLSEAYDITLWGVSPKGSTSSYIKVDEVKYPIKIFSSVKTNKKIIPNLIRVSYNIWRLKREILSFNYDILYIHGIPLSFPFFKQGSTKIVNHIHGLTNPFSMTANRMARNSVSIYLYEKYRNWVVRQSDMIFLASDKQGHLEFSSRYPLERDKIKYIPNFADDNIFTSIKQSIAREKLNLDTDETIFVNTGRVSLQKDPILLVRSFIHYIKVDGGDATLVIIGDGELMTEVKELAENSGLLNKILLTGKLKREEINLWLNAADLYVYTSHANGFPISLVEAAFCGLPIVTTDVTGVHDLVINDSTGYLVNNRKPSEIANSISKALIIKKELSVNILAISNNFTPGIIIGRIKEMLSQY